MPTNTKTVISIVSRTCAIRDFSGMPTPPQKLARNVSQLNAMTMAMIATMIGTSLAIVTTRLMNVACWTPHRIMK